MIVTEAHTTTIDDLLTQLGTDPQLGLSDEEAARRLQKYGENRLKEATAISPWKLFAAQFKNLIVVLLVVAIGISLFLNDILEAIAVFIVIILNALFGFFTEYRAEQAMEALKGMLVASAKVVRNGEMTIIEATELVPGDLLVVEEGDQVTADARLIAADNLAAMEASLTGEAEAVEKQTGEIAETNIPIADRTNMLFMSTTIVRGNGRALVTATGTATEIGEVSNLLETSSEEKTPLEKRLDALGKQLVWLSLAIAGIIIVVGIISGIQPFEILKTSIALAIAAVPEGLLAVSTITLAIGLKRMARQKALIRRLPAVETLGSTTVICTDKTGTLTENQMTLEAIWLGGYMVGVSGTGYQPEGSFDWPTEASGRQQDLDWFLKVGAMSSNAAISQDDEGHWQAVGDPTEAALVVAALKNGFNVQKARLDNYKEEKEIPFSSEEKRMAVYYRSPEGFFVMAKGSPEIILSSCSKILAAGQPVSLDESWQQQIAAANLEMSQKGLRVLGLAYRPVASTEEAAYQDLIFLGLAGIMDPPREEAKAAIAEAKRAGIRTIMITGDQATTAGAIGERLGLTYGQVVNGQELQHMSAEQLGEQLPHTSIFARVSPRDKLQIVRVLKSQGEIVAMTGDGVNDAPALKEADIGVAMGIQGTEVAKQAADMVLSDDNFATIVRAISEGRVIFGNIRKFILYLFSCNLSEILVIFLALVIGLPLPLEALQILWLNLVTDVFPALSLGWEPADKDIMDQPPMDPDQQILTGQFKVQILVYGLVLGLGTLAAYVYTLITSGDLEAARTVAFVTLAAVQLFHAFNIRNRGRLEFNRSLFSNRYLWGAIVLVLVLQALAVYVPILNRVLGTAPLNTAQLMLCLFTTAASILLLQIYNRLQKS